MQVITKPVDSSFADSEILAGLLADLSDTAPVESDVDNEFDGFGADEIVESGATAAHADLSEITDAVEAAERAAAKHALYSEQDAPATTDASAPTTTVEALNATKEEKKAAKAAAKAVAKAVADAEKKAVREAAKGAVVKVPKEPKAPSVPRATSTTHKPGALLMVKLGADARDYLTFSLADAALNEDALVAKQDAFIERMNDNDSIADKVKEKMSMTLCYVKNGGELNEVLKRAFTVLHNEGELTSGDKGNLQLNLLSKPYSMGTSRSQSCQMFMALPELGIVTKIKGQMVANPDSALLPLINAKLGLV